MSTPESIEQLVAEYERQLAGAAEVQRRIREVRGTAVSPRRQVSATVDAQGALVELSLLTDSWRTMASREVTDLIVGTVESARADAMAAIAALVAPTLPPGVDFAELAAGVVDPAVLFRGAPDGSTAPSAGVVPGATVDEQGGQRVR